jgi:hypothetical protein
VEGGEFVKGVGNLNFSFKINTYATQSVPRNIKAIKAPGYELWYEAARVLNSKWRQWMTSSAKELTLSLVD